ncbi:MAG: SsrA-binding protein, partial [Clostridia bacterium]|nr:SsrA-binding protein [Clostridia bacterium]
MKQIAYNKSVNYEYFLEEKFEAGIALEGAEVKSLRAGNCNLKDSFCFIRGGE